MDDAKEIVERCLIHWLPDLATSQRRGIAVSIVGQLAAFGTNFDNTDSAT